MKIKVKNLLPNPFRNIDAYPIDQDKIRQLRNSIRETSFWDNILARPAPKNGRYEIAYGHHRLIAIKEELGEDTLVDIPIRDLSDEAMLRIMANENMEQWTTDWQVIVETVKQTKKFLEEHLDIVKRLEFRHPPKGKIGAVVISKFLGKNWPEGRISRALAIMKDTEIQFASLEQREELKKIDMLTLDKISSIQNQQAKKQWLKQAVKEHISGHEMQEITRFENEPTLTSQDKQTIRTLIQKGEIRGREQIARTVQVYKTRRLYMPKTSPEKEKKRKELGKHLLDIAKDAKHLANLITALSGQLINYPETIELFPPEEAQEANGALQDLFTAIAEFKDIYKKANKKNKGVKALEVKDV